MKKNYVALFLVLFLSVVLVTGCSNASGNGNTGDVNTVKSSLEDRNTDISKELSYKESMELKYAEQFCVDHYEDGYTLISIANDRRYLLIPEGKSVPEDLSEEIVILQCPADHIYLVATAAMDMFLELDALDTIRFSGQEEEGWCMQEVQDKIREGTILYAGKYNMPDYELITSGGCRLAIENNMISHSPEVVEKLEEFGIPVLIDLSSYESHPLGRVEWIKLYGALLGKEEAAIEAFEKQVKIAEQVTEEESTEATVAFFYITANGMVNVRASSDYIPKMIGLAGGKYIFDDLGNEEGNRSTVNMQMEEFYQAAKDADYLIYNSNIDGEITSVEELLAKEELLGDFKAVQEGNVWCSTKDFYQQSMSVGQMIEDIHGMLSGDGEKEKTCIYKVE